MQSSLDRRQNYLVGVTLIVTSTVGWSLTGYFTRLVALDSITLIAWRGLFGAICLVGVAIFLRNRAWRAEFRIFGKWQLLYIANSMAGAVMLFTSFAHTSVAHVAVIFAAFPIIAALLGWLLLQEVPSASSLVASIVAIGGVSIMVAVGTDGGFLGDLLALGMTVTTTLTVILIRRYPTIPVIGCSAASLAMTSLVCWPFADHGIISNLQFAQLALFALVNSVLGVALYALGARRMPAVEVALISTLDMPLSILWVWIAFNERPGLHTVWGGVAVVTAVLFHILAAARRRTPVAA
jgi:drug/metabolite transporter (DMT)-like permease